MQLNFSGSRAILVTRILLINWIIVGLLHLLAVNLELHTANNIFLKYTYLFDLDREYNLPTLYTSILLLIIALLPWLLRLPTKKLMDRIFWTGFSIFFAYWAIDEMFILHEQFAEPLRNLLQIGHDSIFYHAWVLIALGLILALGGFILVYLQFKRPVINKKQLGILVLLFIYMFGIVMFEILGTRVYNNTQLYRLFMVPLEELFEIGMASYLLVKLLRYQE